MNPTILQRKNLQNKLWKLVIPNSLKEMDWELEEQKFAFYDESCYNLLIAPDTTPALYNLCQTVKLHLHVQENVRFFIDNRMRVAGSCIASANNIYPSIICLSSGAINTLNENELAFLVGHELGHIHMLDRLVRFYFYKQYKDKAPRHVSHLFHVFEMLTELEADRYGYLACNSLEAFVNYQYKMIGGIDRQKFGVPIETFLETNRQRVNLFLHGGWLGDRHPANALRIEAIRLFSSCQTYRELQAQMKPIIDSIMNCDD